MQISSDSVFFLTNNESNLTVSLEAYESVDNVAAGILKFLSPVDVVLFVESCLELNKYHYLFAVLGSFEERCDDRRPVRYTVKRLLDSKDIRVSGCLLNELQYGFKCLIRMMNDPVLFPDLLENIEITNRSVK